MKSRFSTVAGFLAAATLLSGSAFAFAPEFTGDLPTVIITDRISNASDPAPFDTPNGSWSSNPSDFRASSAFLFRYETNLDLGSIIDLRDANDISDVKVVFNEFDDTSDSVPNTETTLNINGVDALTDFPVKADYSGANAFTAGLLSFRNIDFSPVSGGDGPFDQIGDVTGQDLELSPSQQRIVTLNIDTADANTYAGSQALSFLVITTIDGTEGDRTSTPEGLNWQVVYEAGTTDSGVHPWTGWGVKLWDNKVTGIGTNGPGGSTVAQSANYSGITISPLPTGATSSANVAVNQTVPGSTAGSTTLNLTTTPAQYGLYAWGLVSAGVTYEANRIYRFRARIASANPASNSTDFVGLQFGDSFNTGVVRAGYTSQDFLTAGSSRQYPGPAATTTNFDAYLLTREAGSSDFNIQLVDQSNINGQDVQIAGVEIAVADRSDLGAGTVVFNQGAPAGSIALHSGEAAPPSGEVAFSTGTTPGVSFGSNTRINTALPSTYTVTGNALTALTGPAPANSNNATTYQEFRQFESYANNVFDINTLDTGFALDNNHIYIMDVWMKASQTGTVIPNIILRNNIDITQYSWSSFWVGAGNLAGSSTDNFSNPALHLTTDAKVYSHVFRPQSPNATAGMFINIGFIWALDGFEELSNTTISVQRIVITAYDAN